MKNFLLISPYFPPMGVSGAKRPLHLARNLPNHGWNPIILAGQPVRAARDEHLVEAVPDTAVVSYAYSGKLRPFLKHWKDKRSRQTKAKRHPSKGADFIKDRLGWDLAYSTPFDRFMYDTPVGLKHAWALAKEHDVQAVSVCSDPWSPLIVGYLLRQLKGLPLILDFRDPWSIHDGKMALRPPPTRRLLSGIEASLFKKAAKVILNTRLCRDAYIDRYAGRIPAERFTFIRNAFDEGVFNPLTNEATADDSSAFKVLYFGTFRRFVEPDVMFEGFARFVRANGLCPRDAKLVLVGGLAPDKQQEAAELGLEDFLEVQSAIPFPDSLLALRSADVLVLVVQPECRLQIPGKLYDYFCARRPILAISANEEVNQMIEESGAGLAAEYGNPRDMANQLFKLYSAAKKGQPVVATKEKIEMFSADTQAREYARVLDEVVRS